MNYQTSNIFNDLSGKALSELCDLISEKCLQSGLLVVHTGRESIKIGPPLTIPDDALIEGIAIISESIQEVYNDKRS